MYGSSNNFRTLAYTHETNLMDTLSNWEEISTLTNYDMDAIDDGAIEKTFTMIDVDLSNSAAVSTRMNSNDDDDARRSLLQIPNTTLVSFFGSNHAMYIRMFSRLYSTLFRMYSVLLFALIQILMFYLGIGS